MPQSYKEYTGSELTATTYSVPFKYLSINDVNALGYDGAKWKALALYPPSPRSAALKTITLAAAPNTLYTTLRLYRATSTTQLIDFQNGSRLAESDLDAAYQQSLFAAQEIAEDASTSQFTAVRDASLQSGTSLSNLKSQEFTGDNSATAFNLTEFAPATVVTEAYRVSIDGVMQAPSDYAISMTNSTITFTSAPPSGSKIVVVTAASAASSVSVDDVTVGLTSANKAEIKDLGVSNAKLAGGITQDKLAGSIATSKLAEVIDDDTMTTGVSATSLASSESIKAYINSFGLTTTLPSQSGGLSTEGEQGTINIGSLIIKYGTINSTSGQTNYSFTTPFPTAMIGINTTAQERVAGAAYTSGADLVSTSGFELNTYSGVSFAAVGRCFFIAIGY